MQSRHLEPVIFSSKAAVAAVISVLVYNFFQLPGAPWVAAVSAVLVTQPDLHSSFQSSFMRVIAVVIGCVCALVVGLLFDKISNLFKLPGKSGLKKSGRQE